MAKVMTHRFAAKCRVCKAEIPAGSRAVWNGKKLGSTHIECAEKAKAESGNEAKETLLRYSDLRQDYISGFGNNGAAIFTRSQNISYWNSLSSDRESPGNWSGSTNAEMRDWLDNGYQVPGLDGVDSTLIPGAPKRKLRFAEEGDEMLIDLVHSGIDEHFISWDKRWVKPALRVRISISFSAYTPAKTVNAYQSWVARMLQTIDSFGLDMSVDLISPGNGQWSGTNAKHTVAIRVKESGEASDFSAWSPMFSPGGFRQLVFLGIIKCADVNGVDVSYGLGRPTDAMKWAVEYEPETNELTVTNNNDRSEFPEFQMTQMLIGILAKITHG